MELRILQHVPGGVSARSDYVKQHGKHLEAARALNLKGQSLAKIAPEHVRDLSRAFVTDLATLEKDGTANDTSITAPMNKKSVDLIDEVRKLVGVPDFTKPRDLR